MNGVGNPPRGRVKQQQIAVVYIIVQEGAPIRRGDERIIDIGRHATAGYYPRASHRHGAGPGAVARDAGGQKGALPEQTRKQPVVSAVGVTHQGLVAGEGALP